MDGVVFVGLHRPGLLPRKGKALGGAFGDAVVGCTLYTKDETFGKGVLRHCAVLVRARRGAVVIRHMACLPGDEGPLQREVIVGAGLLSRGLPLFSGMASQGAPGGKWSVLQRERVGEHFLWPD